MFLRYLGHSCFTVSDGIHTVIFDPFLTGNPDAALGPDDVAADAVLPSHGHGDHLGDTIAIARRLDIPVVCIHELAGWCSRQGVEAVGMSIGGSCEFPFGRLKLTLALHGSGVAGPDGAFRYVGPPCGFLIAMGGRTLYFAGDTALFSDMRLIGDEGVDIALLPIGDHYTMGIDDAVRAVELLRPRVVVPMHYNAFDAIRKDPAVFAAKVAKLGVDCRVMAPGEQTEV